MRREAFPGLFSYVPHGTRVCGSPLGTMAPWPSLLCVVTWRRYLAISMDAETHRRKTRRVHKVVAHYRRAAKPLRPRLDEFFPGRRSDRLWDVRGFLSRSSRLVAA